VKLRPSDRPVLERAAPAAIVLLTLAVYWQVAGHPLIALDDPAYVSRNPVVREGLTPAGILWAFSTFDASNWHPLTWISHMLDVSLFGMRPGAWHLVSVAIHAANAVLLSRLLLRMTGRLAESVLVAALFAVHPLHVESVAWVAERKDVLCTLFSILSLDAWAGYAEKPSASRYAAVVLWFAAALLSKPMAVTLPFVMLLLDRWPLDRRLDAGRLTEKAPLFILSALSCAMTWAAQDRSGAILTTVFPLSERISNALVSCIAYLRMTVWPAGLAIYYPHPGNGIPPWQAAASAVAIGSATVYAATASRRRPWLAVGWFWYLGTLVPVIGVVQVGGQAMADRYTYFPLVGIFIGSVWEISRFLSEYALVRRASFIAACALVAAFACAAWRQTGYWRSDEALFGRALETTGENWMAHAMLADAASARGETDRALRHLDAVITIMPSFAEAHYSAYSLLDEAGRREEALRRFATGLRARKVDPEATVRTGLSFAGSGKLEEAEACFREAIRLRPAYPDAHYHLAVALGRTGRRDEAMPHFEEALKTPAVDDAAHNRIGVSLVRLGRAPEAVPHFREALRLRPENEEARFNLAAALAIVGRKTEAEGLLRAILERKPDDPDALAELARIVKAR
jgi:tetratricopeptide (TPR) repeat protein